MAEGVLLQVPLGFRFCPTNREVVRDFLWPKIFGRPSPTCMIQEADVYGHHPDRLTAVFHPAPSLLQEWWFFARATPKNSSGDRRCRMTPFGRWVITQKAPAVTDEHGREIGKKRSLFFQVKRDGEWVKTNWLMEEFSCRDLELPPLAAKHYPAAQCDDSWVVCRIYLTPAARPEPSSAGKRKMEDVPSTSYGYGSVHEPDFVVEDVPSTIYGYGSVHDPSTDFVEISGLSEPLSVDRKGKGKMVAAVDNQGASSGGLMPLDPVLSSGLQQGHGAITVAVEEIAMDQVWADVNAANSDASLMAADEYCRVDDIYRIPNEILDPPNTWY